MVRSSSYTYDRNGNTLRQKTSQSEMAFQYNSSDRIIKSTINPSPLMGEGQGEGEQNFYSYNDLGMRTRKITEAEERGYLYDQKAIIVEKAEGIGHKAHRAGC